MLLPDKTVNIAAKALSLSPSMTFPKWQTSMDMRMPPVASRRMYRHSATMHNHRTPAERQRWRREQEVRTWELKSHVFFLLLLWNQEALERSYGHHHQGLITFLKLIRTQLGSQSEWWIKNQQIHQIVGKKVQSKSTSSSLGHPTHNQM